MRRTTIRNTPVGEIAHALFAPAVRSTFRPVCGSRAGRERAAQTVEETISGAHAAEERARIADFTFPIVPLMIDARLFLEPPRCFRTEVVDGLDQQPSSGRSDGTEPLSAQPGPFDQNAFDRIAFEPISTAVKPTSSTPRRSLDMRAFNDLKGEARKKQRKHKDHHRRRFGRGGARRRRRRGFHVVRGRPGSKALRDMAPQTGFVEQGVRRDGVGVGNLQPVASVSATPGGQHRGPEVLVARKSDTRWPVRRCSPSVNDRLWSRR